MKMRRLMAEDFGEIYEAYFSRVYNYISYRINNHADTEDLASRVFERVIERYGQFDPERGALEAWVIGIAKHTVTDYFRERSRRPATGLDAVAPYLGGGAQPEEICLRDERHRLLMEALNILSDRERQIVALKYGGGLGNKDIARLLQLSESNVGVILFRSLKLLRSYMDKEESVCDESRDGLTRTGCRG